MDIKAAVGIVGTALISVFFIQEFVLLLGITQQTGGSATVGALAVLAGAFGALTAFLSVGLVIKTVRP
jgi:hypothetical protein